jgi:hypothetical protein
MSNPTPDSLDVRVIERLVAEGRLTREQVEAALAALPDLSDNVEPSQVTFVTNTSARASRGIGN